MEGLHEDHEALFHSYPCAYYVQSPSTISHANSADIRNTTTESAFHSPVRNETNLTHDTSRLALSHSSSRGSNHYFLHHEKKISYDDARSHGTGTTENGDQNRLIIVDHRGHCGGGDDDDDDDEEEEDEDKDYLFYGKRRSRWWKRYFSYRNSDSCVWICLQISWRAMLSFWVALLVFYIATKPPPPKVSIKMAGIREFGLAEGVDGSGVTTKILTCNCSINLIIHNKSKLFGLHINPPTMEMSFGRLPLAFAHGPKLYAESGSTRFQLYVGTRNKPLYGAGRSMEDMLESGKGLPMVVHLRFNSNFRVVWNLVKPKFHHQAQCLLLLEKSYDKKHRTQAYSSTCTII